MMLEVLALTLASAALIVAAIRGSPRAYVTVTPVPADKPGVAQEFAEFRRDPESEPEKKPKKVAPVKPEPRPSRPQQPRKRPQHPRKRYVCPVPECDFDKVTTPQAWGMHKRAHVKRGDWVEETPVQVCPDCEEETPILVDAGGRQVCPRCKRATPTPAPAAEPKEPEEPAPACMECEEPYDVEKECVHEGRTVCGSCFDDLVAKDAEEPEEPEEKEAPVEAVPESSLTFLERRFLQSCVNQGAVDQMAAVKALGRTVRQVRETINALRREELIAADQDASRGGNVAWRITAKGTAALQEDS